jgi:2-keto-3-deoxy-L-rhamnonate aldolase RhmA
MTDPTLTAFAARVRAGETVVGTFIKSRSYEIVEIAAETGIDFVVLDAEHAPLDRAALDGHLLAARACALPALVRVPDAMPATIGAVLDMGACGVMVPHVVDADAARAAVAAARYCGGVRGFSNSPRAGRYGSIAMAEHLAASDAAVLVVCQIEDRAGVENVADIAAVPGVDVLFIGRADLAVAYGATSVDASPVEQAVAAILGVKHGSIPATGIFLAEAANVPAYRGRGATFYVIGSDQSHLRAGLARTRVQIDAAGD